MAALYLFLLFICSALACQKQVKLTARLTPSADPRAVARRQGFEYVGPVGSAFPDVHEFVVGCADEYGGDHSEAVRSIGAKRASRLRDNPPDPDILSETIQQKSQKQPRSFPDGVTASADGYRPVQWHLSSVQRAWAGGEFGRGATIAVVDDGVDYTHRDIARGFVRELSANFNDDEHPTDPMPKGGYAHGTSASAVAAASGLRSPPNAPHCGHGVAPLAKLAGIQLIAGPSSDLDEAHALSDGAASVSVYSCSWGPSDDGETLGAPGELTRAAIEHGAKHGRGGLGSVYVWAGGNGYRNGDNCAYDGYASNPFTVAVAAVTHLGKKAWYSESCSGVFVSAPSSGDGRSILTADVTGTRGSSPDDCNPQFGGTSAAAPFVAGVAALVVGANAALTERDVERILAATAQKNDPTDLSWRMNGAGIWRSSSYGFGMVDAHAAVTLAKQWTPVPKEDDLECRVFASVPSAGVLIPTEGRASSVIRVDDPPCPHMVVERAEAAVSVRHGRRGDLEFALISPEGTRSVFEPRFGDYGADLNDWPFESCDFWGEDASGPWTLEVRDVWPGVDGGRLRGWSIRLFGRAKK